MDELIRGFEEVLSDTAQLLGLEEAEPVRRYDPPTRPSYAEPVSHATDAARPKKYTGEVALPLTEFSISQVCEWALSLNLDASPFWDYGINGAVLVTLSDDDFRNLLGLKEAQVSRLRHALRDVTEVEEGHPSAAAKPAFRPNTGSMPVAHVAPLRKGTVAGEAPATGRSNVDSLSAATVAKLSDDELVAAFGLTPEEVLALRSRTRSASVNHANEATPQLPPSAPAAAPPAAAAAPEPVFPPLAAAVPVVATVHAVEDAAPAKAAAPLAAASIAARNALFGDDDDDDDGIFAPVAKPHAPAAASPAPQAPVAAIFADDEEGSLFRAAPAAAPKAAVPIAVKKPLFEDDDEDDGYVFARPAAAPAAAAPALPTAPPVTAAPVASKPLFDDDDDTESEPSKPVVVKEDAADDPLSSWQAAPEPAPPVTAPPPAVKPPVRAKALFDDDDDDDDSPLGLGRSMPSRVPAQPVAPPVPQPNRRGILDIGTGIGATDEDAVDSARAQESSEVVKAQMAAHLDELHAAAEDAEREAEHFQATFSALEQKLASLEAKAGGTRAEAREGSAASAPPSGLLFADDAQDESVLRAESLLSTLNLLTKPAGEAPAAAAAVGQSIFDDLPKQESKVEQVTAVVAPAAATPSPAKRSVLFDDSDDEELPVAPPPVSAAAVPAAADSEPIQHAPSLACEDEVTAPGQATPAVALPEPPSKPSALFDDEASEQVTSPKEIEAVADSVDITPPPPAPLPEQPPVDASHEDEQLVGEAQRVLQLLVQRRDMSMNEVRLVLMVEDPRATKRREEYGIEVASGVSRDEILAALTDVSAGRIPADKLALRQLVTELQNWPYLENDDSLRGTGPSPYAEVTNTGATKAQRMAEAQARAAEEPMSADEAPDLSDYLPKWVGFSAVYLISAIPVFITLAVLALLFITSLK